MLYEPTYVIPDVRNGLGNGVVDANNNITVSWRVNGQPYMVAYKITIYTNQAAATQIYTTGKVDTPLIYAFDGDGNPTYWEAIISKVDFGNLITNGNEYKMEITQWWGSGPDDFIVQSSPSVFITRAEPTVSIGTIGSGGYVPEEQTDGDEAEEEGDDETQEQKDALLDIVAQLAYTVPNGQDYVDDLEEALYPSVTLTGITAVFSQGTTVIYQNGTLAELRPMLTVYANFSDSSSYPISDYVLQGTLNVGTSEITVLYQGETTTFHVVVTDLPIIQTVDYTFTGTYTQANGDGITFVRWRIAVLSQEDDPIYDTGNLYGVAVLKTRYMGFLTGVNYAVRLNGQTQSGVLFDTGWVAFGVSYETEISENSLIATPICGAVHINFTGASYIPGFSYGSVAISNGVLQIGEGSYAGWQNANGQSLNLMPPLTAVISGAYYGHTGGETTLFRLTGTTGQSWVHFIAYEEKIDGRYYVRFILRNGNSFHKSTEKVKFADEVFFKLILTPSASYILYGTYSADPSVTETFGPVPQMPVISAVYIGGTSNNAKIGANYFEIMAGAPSAELLQEMLDGDAYVPAWKDADYMLADFEDGTLNAGQERSQGQIIGYDLYRRTTDEDALTLAARLDATGGGGRYDYSVVNGRAPYEWRLFPRISSGGQTIYQSTNIVSKSVSVCFWSWMIIEAAPTENKNIFDVKAVYRFGKNLESGSSSNNSSPSIQNNLTRYPTVQRAYSLYKSGTLSSLIGVVDAEGNYDDTIAQRDAIFNLAASKNALFLKNRKGDLLRIAISGEITAITMDNTAEQAQNMTIPWVEIGPADNVSLIGNKAL